jgi:hypothetical protein
MIVRTRYISEEDIWDRLAPRLWTQLARYGTVSSLPMIAGVDILVSFRARTAAQRTRVCAQVTTAMRNSKIWPHVWAVDNRSLEERIARQLARLPAGFSVFCDASLTSCLAAVVSRHSAILLQPGKVLTLASGSLHCRTKARANKPHRVRSGYRIHLKFRQRGGRARIHASLETASAKRLDSWSPFFFPRDDARRQRMALHSLFAILSPNPTSSHEPSNTK